MYHEIYIDIKIRSFETTIKSFSFIKIKQNELFYMGPNVWWQHLCLWHFARYLLLSVSELLLSQKFQSSWKMNKRILLNRCPGLRTASQYAIKWCQINIWTHSKYSRLLLRENGCLTECYRFTYLLLYLLYMRRSGFQIYFGGILMSPMSPYSVLFQIKLMSVHS